VTLRGRKCGGRRGDSWLYVMPLHANSPWCARIVLMRPWAASFATPYGERGRIGVPSSCGLDGASPNTSLDVDTHTRGRGSAASAASASTVAVAPAIAASVCVGSSHESGTNVGAARW